MYKLIAITNRHICNGDFIERIDKISKSGIYAIILREKDLPESEYETLASDVIDICKKNNCICILHSYIDVAERLNHKLIHLPMPLLVENSERLKNFELVGASAHSLEEALTAKKLGADYITASHIFATDCKKGLEPRGLDFLNDICKSVDIPVFALGGINADNISECIKNGAAGVCMMSEFMKCDDVNMFFDTLL
jgi:thiamine-phosphate pyrophosphorylase